VNDLSLQVRLVNYIEIHDAETPDASRRQVQAERRAEAPRADHQHARRFELPLPLHPDFRHDEVTTVSRDLLV
jgi:hypothetical protein